MAEIDVNNNKNIKVAILESASAFQNFPCPFPPDLTHSEDGDNRCKGVKEVVLTGENQHISAQQITDVAFVFQPRDLVGGNDFPRAAGMGNAHLLRVRKTNQQFVRVPQDTHPFPSCREKSLSISDCGQDMFLLAQHLL